MLVDRPETQADRCSTQRHLWRRQPRGHMACACGAVHPDDLDAFLASLQETCDA